MKERFIVISLYVDDKKKLPASKQFTYKTKDAVEKEINTEPVANKVKNTKNSTATENKVKLISPAIEKTAAKEAVSAGMAKNTDGNHNKLLTVRTNANKNSIAAKTDDPKSGKLLKQSQHLHNSYKKMLAEKSPRMRGLFFENLEWKLEITMFSRKGFGWAGLSQRT